MIYTGAARIVTPDGEIQSITKNGVTLWERNLPADYEELEYITAANSQYFFVNGFFLKSTSIVTVKLRFSGSAGNCYGCYTGSSAQDNFCLYGGSSSSDAYIRYDGELDRAFRATAGTDYTIEHSADGFKANGTTYATFAAKTFTCANPFGVGQLSGSSSAKFSGRIYDITVVDSNAESLHLIPVRRISTSQVGMYDIVGKAFYVSQSTPFVEGPDKYAA